MPKGKKKKEDRGGRRRGEAGRNGSDEDGDTGDNMSVVSSASETHSIALDGAEDEIDETSAQENFEDKVKDVIDGTTQKSAKGRTESLLGLKAAMSKKYMYDFIADRKLTIGDGIERCLKKGKGEEQAAAAMCASALLIQLGAGDEGEEIFKILQPTLQVILADTTASPKARGAVAEAYAMGAFIATGDMQTVVEVMKNLENVFKASYWKGDGKPPTHTPEVAALHTAAISGWSFLMSLVPHSSVIGFADSHMSKLQELLNSPAVELRIAAGEAIALIYDLARQEDEDYEGDDFYDLCDTLKQLATDGNKHRAKKDRRTQRSSFRDILRCVEEGDAPDYTVKFGIESVRIDSWTSKRQYDSLCHLLGTGMNVHLQENDLLRDIFGLGAPIPVGALPPQKVSRFDRHMYNAAAFKARTKARSKNRDKRQVSASMD